MAVPWFGINFGFHAVEDQRMVELIDDLPFNDPLQVAEIDDHTQFGGFRVGLCEAGNCHRKGVGVSVNVPAWPVMPVKGVCCLEGELFGDPDLLHIDF